jgi:hypothetical protein
MGQEQRLMAVPPTIRWILQGVFAFTILTAAIYLFIFAVNAIHRRQGISPDVKAGIRLIAGPCLN